MVLPVVGTRGPRALCWGVELGSQPVAFRGEVRVQEGAEDQQGNSTSRPLSCSQLPLEHRPPAPIRSCSQSQPWIPSLMLPLPAPSRWLLRGSDSQTFVSRAWAHFLCPQPPPPPLPTSSY